MAMVLHGIDSQILCATSTIRDERIVKFNYWQRKIYALKNRLNKQLFGKKIIYNFSYSLFGNNISHNQLIKNADIIYLHWTQGGFLNLNNISKILKLGKPVVLSLRDFWYMTGGCHHPVSCINFHTSCGHCPNLTASSDKDLSHKQWRKKSKIYSSFSNVFVFVSSNWMVDHVRKSSLLSRHRTFCIPNLIDEDVFKPIPKVTARIGLAIDDTNQRNILFGAVNPTSNKNKGWDYLVEALKILKNDFGSQFRVFVFGCEENIDITNQMPIDVVFLGKISSEAKLAMAYSYCDVFVTPSLSEPFGNTTLESLACGTPVVSFAIGGANDMIDHKGNGYLARYKDNGDFAKGIKYCLENNLTGYLRKSNKTEFVIKQHLALFKLAQDNS